MHLKARTHSYANIGWMCFCAGVCLYFSNIKFNVENRVRCVAVRDEENYNNFKKYTSLLEAMQSASSIQDIRDVSGEYEFVLGIISMQAFIMFFTSFMNFLSHFIIPDLLMYAKQIKIVSSLNLVICGCVCLVVLIYYRFNDAANFCTGAHLTEEQRLEQLSI